MTRSNLGRFECTKCDGEFSNAYIGTRCRDCGSPLLDVTTGEIVPDRDNAPQIVRKLEEPIGVAGELESSMSGVSHVIVATSNDIPGYVAFDYRGEVVGITVIVSNVIANFGANMRKYVGGEVGAYVKMLTDGRNVALSRMKAQAVQLNANAVIAMRLDANQISDVMTELIAYGTAVSIKPADDR